jgi:hypothetical protein
MMYASQPRHAHERAPAPTVAITRAVEMRAVETS